MPRPKQYDSANARLKAFRERRRQAQAEAEQAEREREQTQRRERQALRQAVAVTVWALLGENTNRLRYSVEASAQTKLGRELTDTDRETLQDETERVREGIRRGNVSRF